MRPAVTATFRRAVAFSFCRIAGGFALALVLAFVLALAAGRWPVVEVLLRPYVLAIKAVPVASFIILALIWMRTSALPLFISFLMVFPILYTNVLAGLRSADSQLWKWPGPSGCPGGGSCTASCCRRWSRSCWRAAPRPWA